MYLWAQRFPPILVRLLARERYGPPLSTEIIAARSGLSAVEVEAISSATNWCGIDVWKMQSFTHACGIHFDNYQSMRRTTQYLRAKQNFRYLTKNKHWEDYYLPKLVCWAKSVSSNPPAYPPLRNLFNRMKKIVTT